jgi:hypothetical protein
MKREIAKFDSEAQMCALFIAIATGEVANSNHRARPTGWKAYAETGGFDILMARADGFQVGIEAKLRLNDDVILQAMEQHDAWGATMSGPDCRAVLVPYGTGSRLHHVACKRMGIQIITIAGETMQGRHQLVHPDLPMEGHWQGDWPEMLPTQRIKLPEFVPDVAAGSPSPLQLTVWKVKAIKIACIMERRGWVCRQDFKHIGIDHRRYLDSRWISVVDGAWRRGPSWPDLRAQHPRNFGEIDALYENWKPPELAHQATYGRLL